MPLAAGIYTCFSLHSCLYHLVSWSLISMFFAAILHMRSSRTSPPLWSVQSSGHTALLRDTLGLNNDQKFWSGIQIPRHKQETNRWVFAAQVSLRWCHGMAVLSSASALSCDLRRLIDFLDLYSRRSRWFEWVLCCFSFPCVRVVEKQNTMHISCVIICRCCWASSGIWSQFKHHANMGCSVSLLHGKLHHSSRENASVHLHSTWASSRCRVEQATETMADAGRSSCPRPSSN